jgi:putative ABC transport system substrate-binding protein
MRRREFITLLGGAAVARPLGVQAQEAGRSYSLGLLNPLPREMPQFVSFFDELRRFGFVEGQNLIVDGRGFASRPEQFAERAVEIVKSGVNVVVCGGDVAIRAAQQATATVPLLGISDDMLAQRHVSSLARPDGNTTGISILATELDGKRQEILIELVPAARRMAALADSATTAPSHLQALQDAARGRGVELSIHQVARPEEIGPAIEAAHTSGVQAINVLATALLNAHRRLIFERTAVLRLPAIYQFPESAEDGGLFGYGSRITEIYRQIARQVVKILRGAKLSDVPVEQPTTFELVINLKTAKALGLEVSPAMLNRADKVIE